MKAYVKFLLCILSLPLLTSLATAEAEQLKKEGGVAFLEGPAWRSDGVVFFTDIPNNKIMRRDLDGKIRVHRTPSGHANGLLFDSKDRLLIAEDDGRLMRENLDGSVEVLADQYKGKRFNSLNDLGLDTKGRIYFTDPAYNRRAKAPQRNSSGEVIDGIYLLDENGKLGRILDNEIQRPNGILVSPRDEFLYIADNHGQAADGARKLWRFDLDKKGKPIAKTKKLMFDWGTDRGPDGMALDVEGNIYVAAGLNYPLANKTSLIHKAGIYIVSPQGKLRNFIPLPIDIVSNVAFGGKDFKTLYITGGHNLWSYKVDTRGYQPF